jgi:RNA polymerase sigma factor for flagellar operon FliA
MTDLNLNMDKIWIEYKNTSSKDAKEKLIIQYVDIVKIIAGRLYTSFNSKVEYDELVSYGILGLIDAIEKFNLQKDVKFETYANIRIKGSIIDQIRTNDWVPRSVRTKFKEYEKSYSKLYDIYGENLKEEQIAADMNISTDELGELLGQSTSLTIMSLDEKISESVNFNIANENKEFEPESNFLESEMKKILTNAIDSLNEKEKLVVQLYYYSDLTFKEIAQVMGITESRVSQIHSKSIMKLKIGIDK